MRIFSSEFRIIVKQKYMNMILLYINFLQQLLRILVIYLAIHTSLAVHIAVNIIYCLKDPQDHNYCVYAIIVGL